MRYQMSDELREAAERRRKPRSLVDVTEANNYGQYYVRNQEWTDLNKLADAFCDEHPSDDDTPIDEAWLLAAGFEWYEPDECWMLDGPPDIKAWIRSRDDNQWEWHVYDAMVPTCRNHGQLRRLCSALGIELKENK